MKTLRVGLDKYERLNLNEKLSQIAAEKFTKKLEEYKTREEKIAFGAGAVFALDQIIKTQNELKKAEEGSWIDLPMELQ